MGCWILCEWLLLAAVAGAAGAAERLARPRGPRPACPANHPKRPAPVSVYVAVLFNHEVDLLEVHLHEAFPAVRGFVVVESDLTWNGRPKKCLQGAAVPTEKGGRLCLANPAWAGRFARFTSKLHYVQCKLTELQVRSHREHGQRICERNAEICHAYCREQLGEAVRSLDPPDDAIVVLADLDEIVRRRTLRQLAACSYAPPMALELRNHMYTLEWVRQRRSKKDKTSMFWWAKRRWGSSRFLQTLALAVSQFSVKMRGRLAGLTLSSNLARHFLSDYGEATVRFEDHGLQPLRVIKAAGWHLSWFGGLPAVRVKLPWRKPGMLNVSELGALSNVWDNMRYGREMWKIDCPHISAYDENLDCGVDCCKIHSADAAVERGCVTCIRRTGWPSDIPDLVARCPKAFRCLRRLREADARTCFHRRPRRRSARPADPCGEPGWGGGGACAQRLRVRGTCRARKALIPRMLDTATLRRIYDHVLLYN